LAAISGALALILTSACGVGSDSSQKTSHVLRVVLQNEPTSLNPTFSPFSDSRAWGGLFDSLVGYDRGTLKVDDQGLLPTWKQTAPTEWLFDVRKDVTFHDGEKFDAAAAAFTIKELRDNPKSILRSYYDIVADAVPAGGQLKITTTQPYAALPQVLTTAYALPPKDYAEKGAEKFAQQPVGTGPFKLDAYRSGQELDVTRFDGYWRGKPKLDGITYTWNGEASSRYALLASGDVDLAIGMEPQDVKKLQSSDNLKVTSGESTYGLTIFLNTTKGPLANVKLREAVAKSIDRDGIVKSIFQGTGAVPSHYFIGDLLTKPFEVDVPMDVNAAKALVSQAGGASLTFGYTSGKYPSDTTVGDAVSGMLKQVGFTVKQQAEEYGAWRELRDKGAFDLFMFEATPTFPHPDTYVSYFLGENASLKTCTNGADYDAYNQKALSADSVEASDEVYQQLETQVISEDYCYVPLTKSVYSYGMSDRVTGFKAPRNASPDYFALSLD
jgi:peptide/nickel transport system substrate-binding protein